MIQTYSLGTAVTRIDGANIATGTINAQDAILQGSLTADRINATSIQASTLLIPAIVNGINGGVGGTWIDGGSIRTGTVDTNRLNVTGVIQAINNEGSTTISGGKITTGTITTGHLTADSLTAGKIKASLLDVDGMITVVNGGSVTKITGAGIATTTITSDHIAASGIVADKIKTGSLVSQGTGAYQTFNATTQVAEGFKLSHDTFSVANCWGRTQQVQAEFGSTVMVRGYPLGPAIAVPLSALDSPPLDQINQVSGRVFYKGNNGGVPNIDCLDLCDYGVSMVDHNYMHLNLQWRLQPSKLSDNLDAMRMIRIKVFPKAGSSTPYATVYAPLFDRLYAALPIRATANTDNTVINITSIATNAVASCVGSTLTFTTKPTDVSLTPGMFVVGSGIPAGTIITSQINGDSNSYQISQSLTFGAQALWVTPAPLQAGMEVAGDGIPCGTTITARGTGVGGTGTYTLSQAVTTAKSGISVDIATDCAEVNAARGVATIGYRMSSDGSGVFYNGSHPYTFCGHLLVAISNVYGWSPERWFHPASTAMGVWYTRDVASVPGYTMPIDHGDPGVGYDGPSLGDPKNTLTQRDLSGYT